MISCGSAFPVCQKACECDPPSPSHFFEDFTSSFAFLRCTELNINSSIANIRECLMLLPHSFRLIVAYFFYSDGYNTISNVGIIFAQAELKLGSSFLIFAAIISPTMAIIGLIFWRQLQVKFDLNSYQLTFILTGCMFLFPLYMSLGLIIPGAKDIPIGMYTGTELLIAIAWYGFCLGGIQSYSVSLAKAGNRFLFSQFKLILCTLVDLLSQKACSPRNLSAPVTPRSFLLDKRLSSSAFSRSRTKDLLLWVQQSSHYSLK